MLNVRSQSPQLTAASAGAREVPIGDVLSQAARELVCLARLLENLQSHILPVLQDAAALDAQVLKQVQSFDHIGQIAHGLGDFLAALAAKTPKPWRVDAAAAATVILLADLSSRLGSSGEEKSSSSGAWGDYELF